MAKADDVQLIVRYALEGDDEKVRAAVKLLASHEREAGRSGVASGFEELLRRKPVRTVPPPMGSGTEVVSDEDRGLVVERTPARTLDGLVLPAAVRAACEELVEEQRAAELLIEHGLEPRNRMLLVGPPGNGKTSLAEAVAAALDRPLLTASYESLISSRLGATSAKLGKIFDIAATRACVLFLDEIDALGEDRGSGDQDVAEMKRVVNTLLLRMDSVPSYVVVIAATNLAERLDRAAWRRFQFRLELPAPGRVEVEAWLAAYARRSGFDFGVPLSELACALDGRNFAEVEEFARTVRRRYVLDCGGEGGAEQVVRARLSMFAGQAVLGRP